MFHNYLTTKPLNMNCTINNVIDQYHRKGKQIDVIRRYIKMRYKINIDLASIKERIRILELRYNY